MKQVLQERRSGEIVVVDLPDPIRTPGRIHVRTRASVISAGTESALAAATGRSLLQRIADKPELLRKGLTTLRERGLGALRDQIDAKYAGYEPLGYSCAGVVIEGDPEAPELPAGARVACGGIGYAMHAEHVVVPHRLCARVPDRVDDETAAYATLGAIAMQGVRQAGAALGENIAVIGLGLVGLLATQLLKAAGCRVIGVDPAEAARDRARLNGCERTADLANAPAAVADATRGIGVDAVLICAAASDSGPVALAGELARSRGRVVMVGATGMEIPRELYFRKELSFALSRSYGPGRYDPTYEEGGADYPVEYVRFTEQRNMQAFLDLAASGAISVTNLTTHRFPLTDAPKAYALLKDRAIDRAGIVLTYPADSTPVRKIVLREAKPAGAGSPGVSLIGAGAYAGSVLIPLLREHSDVALRGVAARRPDQAASTATRFGFAFSASGIEQLIADRDSNIVLIATRHDSHADLAAAALAAGKHVWVEKPLALDEAGLARAREAHAKGGGLLAVGFNRRFSPLSASLRALRETGGPAMITIRVNAGRLPPTHWTHDPTVGGGRLLGEGCHFFDYLCFLTGSVPRSVHAGGLASERPDLPIRSNFSATVAFADGSVGHVIYSSDGGASMPKERIELFCGGKSAALDDFRSLTIFNERSAHTESLRTQDKGQRAMLAAFLDAVRGRHPFPVQPEAFFTSTRLTLAAQQSLDSGQPIRLHPD